ncbi:MAG: thioredoxin domain-containing protein [Deltaproteobacteria bacterium]|nr:thioredoxin domain-containing protein [Nannocystaceae bacterium]
MPTIWPRTAWSSPCRNRRRCPGSSSDTGCARCSATSTAATYDAREDDDREKNAAPKAQRFLADMRAETTAEAIAQQQRTCVGNGAEGTPSFFINGDLLVGAQPYERFAAIIDEELAQ